MSKLLDATVKIRLPKSMKKTLERLAADDGLRDVSSIVRRAIMEYLDRHGQLAGK